MFRGKSGQLKGKNLVVLWSDRDEKLLGDDRVRRSQRETRKRRGSRVKVSGFLMIISYGEWLKFSSLYFIVWMREKHNVEGPSPEPHKNNSLNALRQQLKNKLIEVGIACGGSARQEHPRIATQGISNEGSKLPCIPSLKTSLIANYEDARIQLSHKINEIFCHRDLFIGRDGFAASKGSRSRKHSRQSSEQSIQDSFRRRVMENVKLHKRQGRLPSIKQTIQLTENSIEGVDTIFIRALRECRRSKEIIHASSRGRLVKRSKTEGRQPGQKKQKKKGKGKIRELQIVQGRQLTPWAQENQAFGWNQLP